MICLVSLDARSKLLDLLVQSVLRLLLHASRTTAFEGLHLNTWVQLLECTFQALMGPLAVRHQASLMDEVGPAKQRPISAHQCSIQQAFGPKSASAVFPRASESPPPPPGTGSPPAGCLRSQRPPIPSEPPLRPLLTALDPGLELSLEPCLWSGPGSRA